MGRPPIPIPEDLRTVARVFDRAGYQCWLVGGAVRDGLLGRGSEDFDLATDARPEVVVRMFRRTIPTGIKHGTVTILFGNHRFETTTFRIEGDYSDGRRPDAVLYAANIREDLGRRDFTINAIAWDLLEGRILDPHDGRGDLKRKTIRAIGNPAERFGEDALRPIRACRFASQLGCEIDPATLAAFEGARRGIRGLSIERIWEELKKILLSPLPSRAFRLFRDTGVLDEIMPELSACVGVGQKGGHVPDVFDHSLAACDMAARDNLAVRAAALFHDIAKPRMNDVGPGGEATFHPHDTVGAEIAEGILRRYKASNADRERITRLLVHHGFHYTSDWTNAGVRRFIKEAGLDIVDDLIALRIAEGSAIGSEDTVSTADLFELAGRIDGIVARNETLGMADLAVDGHILMAELEMKPGRRVGSLLEHLLERVLEDPGVNHREKLLELSKRWLESCEG